MSPIFLRRLMRGHRRRSAVLAILLLLVVALAAHHIAPMHAGMHMGPVQVCVAVLALGTIALAAGSRPVSILPRPRGVLLPLATQIAASPRPAAARAGPVRLQVLRL